MTDLKVTKRRGYTERSLLVKVRILLRADPESEISHRISVICCALSSILLFFLSPWWGFNEVGRMSISVTPFREWRTDLYLLLFSSNYYSLTAKLSAIAELTLIINPLLALFIALSGFRRSELFIRPLVSRAAETALFFTLFGLSCFSYRYAGIEPLGAALGSWPWVAILLFTKTRLGNWSILALLVPYLYFAAGTLELIFRDLRYYFVVFWRALFG